ncbi:hypothetical protein [Corynebacterium bovis]|uniref:hypothetical protein n=1 Tax=Corynebacterium bovis TaxID=36808 RepID=UPI000F63A53B|nr:hypothetical protein [Corynebacterium bovis]
MTKLVSPSFFCAGLGIVRMGSSCWSDPLRMRIQCSPGGEGGVRAAGPGGRAVGQVDVDAPVPGQVGLDDLPHREVVVDLGLGQAAEGAVVDLEGDRRAAVGGVAPAGAADAEAALGVGDVGDLDERLGGGGGAGNRGAFRLHPRDTPDGDRRRDQ